MYINLEESLSDEVVQFVELFKTIVAAAMNNEKQHDALEANA